MHATQKTRLFPSYNTTSRFHNRKMRPCHRQKNKRTTDILLSLHLPQFSSICLKGWVWIRVRFKIKDNSLSAQFRGSGSTNMQGHNLALYVTYCVTSPKQRGIYRARSCCYKLVFPPSNQGQREDCIISFKPLLSTQDADRQSLRQIPEDSGRRNIKVCPTFRTHKGDHKTVQKAVAICWQ